MDRKSLKKFNPDRVAAIEVRMWQAYYRHNFIQLFFLLAQLTRESFGVNYFASVQIAYYAATAAADFRLNKGNENSARILQKLIKFMRAISTRSLESFDYQKAAEFELEWWFVDRYPERYQITREQALANAMSAIYQVEPEKLTEYATCRAQAMVMQDKVEKLKGVEPDWDKMGRLLEQSFRALYKTIQ